MWNTPNITVYKQGMTHDFLLSARFFSLSPLHGNTSFLFIPLKSHFRKINFKTLLEVQAEPKIEYAFILYHVLSELKAEAD